ncbi:MAG: hypothetical protein ACK5JD_01675 [Mangrovibacterium sp.]
MNSNDRFEKRGNEAFAVVFGTLGGAALGGAMYFGAWHQLGLAVVCAVVMIGLLSQASGKPPRGGAI